MEKQTSKMNEKNPGTTSAHWYEFKGKWERVDAEVITEALITIYINDLELVTIMGTPYQQDALAIGFLKNEGLIHNLDEIENLHISKHGCCVEIWLKHAFERPERTIITSGCGGGMTFDDPNTGLLPLQSNLCIQPKILHHAFRQLQPPSSLYARSRGVHAAGLFEPVSKELIFIAEDVGRHNTIDKITGICLQENIKTEDHIILVTGRVSSEMLKKTASLGCPIIASRTSPTSMSVEMAQTANITLIGYVRQGGMRIYSHPERVGLNME
jgi:FdhD protein